MKRNQAFIGIDYSYTSPSITFFDGENYRIHSLNKRKNFKAISQHENFTIFQKSYDETISYTTQFERYEKLSNWCVETILNECQFVDNIYIGLEGYSMGSQKGLLFNIAENTAIMKYKLLKMSNIMKFITYAPTTIKKSASGKGNSDKIGMADAFVNEFGFSMHVCLELSKPEHSPANDIVDSVFIAREIFRDVQNSRKFTEQQILIEK